jgi:hypothetical protein
MGPDFEAIENKVLPNEIVSVIYRNTNENTVLTLRVPWLP